MIEPGDEYGEEFIRSGDVAWFPTDEALAKGVEDHSCYHDIGYAVGLNSQLGVTAADFVERTRSRDTDARRVDTGVNLSILQGWEELCAQAEKVGALRYD